MGVPLVPLRVVMRSGWGIFKTSLPVAAGSGRAIGVFVYLPKLAGFVSVDHLVLFVIGDGCGACPFFNLGGCIESGHGSSLIIIALYISLRTW